MNKSIILEQNYKRSGLRIFLSPMEDSHINHLIGLTQDPSLIDLMGINLSIKSGDIEGFLQTISAYTFPYCLKSQPLIYGAYLNLESLPIGYGVLKGFNMDLLAAEIGVAILDPKYRNQGHGRLVLNRLVTYGFHELGIQMIGAAILRSNVLSINMCKKLGFVVKEYNSWSMPNGDLESMALMELQAKDFTALS